MSEPVAWRVATGRITTGFGWLLFDDLGEAQSYCDDDEPEPLYPADEIERLTQQRDELLGALKESRRWIGDGDCSDSLGSDYWTPEYKAAVEIVDAAIAKAESS